MKKKLLFAAIFIIVIFVGLRSSSAFFFSIKDHACSAGELLSDKHVSSISQYIVDQADNKLSPHVLIAQVQKEFPVIKKMVISFRPLGAQVTLEPHEPICSINDMFVLTSHNTLLPKNTFSSQSLEMIPAVSVAENSINSVTTVLSDILSALPSNFDNFYNLDFINEHCIRLVDKHNAHFAIVLAYEQKDYPQLLERCEIIKNNLSSRGAFDRGMEWIADARFAHYIVAYKA
jgi:hypothetical protein